MAWVAPALIQRTDPLVGMVFKTGWGTLQRDPRGRALMTPLCCLQRNGLAYFRLNDPGLTCSVSPNW